MLILIYNIWNGVVLALAKQEVRWYWRLCEFECAIAWYTVNDAT